MVHGIIARVRRALALVLVATSLAFADEPPLRNAADLAVKERELARSIAGKHLVAARRLEKRPREAYEELALALAIDPSNELARSRLPRDVPPPSAKPLLENEKKTLAKEHAQNAAKLVALARRAKAGGLEDDARRIAALALEEDPGDAAARELLGHARSGEAWLSPREAALRAEFAKVPPAKPEAALPEPIAAVTKVGGLTGLETPHASYLVSRAAGPGGLEELVRRAEATWSLVESILEGRAATPGKQATGAAAVSSERVCFLVVAEAEHAPFVKAVVKDAKLHAYASSLGGWNQEVALKSGSVYILESFFAPEFRVEWACNAVTALLASRHYATTPPGFIDDALKRYFGGRVSGRADHSYSERASGQGSDDDEGASFDELRSRVRPALRLAPEGFLRVLLAKKAQELTLEDSAIALALADLLFAKQRDRVLPLISSFKGDELPAATVERVLGKKLEDLERELRAFAREEY